nr:lipopolysaccharide kinase InaA family protein [Endozoicomonas sp. OPT23]
MYSRVYKCEENVYKTVKVSHFFRDNFRLMTSRSKSYDEIKGNRFLKKIGVTVPKIKFWGVAPLSNTANELLIIENLRDHLPIEHHTAEFRLNGKLDSILKQVASDINLMASHGAIYRDLHFQNVMSTIDGDVCWIDTGLKYIRSLKKLNHKLKVKIQVLKRDMYESGLLSAAEWQGFYEQLEYGR